MQSIIEKILIENQIAYAVFDHNLALSDKSKNLNKILNVDLLESNNSLFEIFPEFFGLEKDIDLIINGKKKSIQLEKINKYDKKGELFYLDLSLQNSDKNEKNLVLIITNSTDKSILEQKIRQQKNEINLLKESLTFYSNGSISNILGNSEKINAVKSFIKKIAKIPETTILLTGESGTGKTLIARSIHNLSQKTNSPFVEINCATIPASLIESEIFGHTKGAFTNAIENKKGLIEEAEGGTLFLDEIGELPIELQPKLLTFLETKKFRPVGSTKEVSVNTRIISATNKDLKTAIKEKEFREDLFYRVNVVSFDVPPLRERKDDIILLAEYFIKTLSKDFNKKVPIFSAGAKNKLKEYSWPGNIRELKNSIERTLIFSENEKIEANEITLLSQEENFENTTEFIIPENGISLFDVEKKYIENALKQSNGNQTQAAKLLNLSLDTLRYRIKKYKIESDNNFPE
ncbi:MAG: sigma-54-dependent Fis family transcriptional regulator [Ignavibacteriae bacterium]|nr:sigma-54-dependent Fis family transcriptional regulator [Ignavibacteriota bacterium]MCB9209651.1 sigma-54-dependent Fis family transcriptional regulator [Ignavibacteriales bacterium]MCB9218807.1 sigma-54-dependent Fis family transcriptional regulator [Ignavibacteriales bacterium]